MNFQKRRILVISIAVVMIVFNVLLAIGHVSPVEAQSSLAANSISSITEYSTPGGDPWGTAFDASGRVWVALPGCDGQACSSSNGLGKLALFDPGTQGWTSVVLPTGYGQPLFVAVDHNGKVWFTMPATNAIAKYDPVSATVSQWAVPTASAGPWGIAIDLQGKIWFTENPDTVALIGEYTSQGALNEYKIRNSSTGGTGLTPHLITIDHNGNIWWSEGWVAMIGKLTVANAQPGTNSGVSEFHYPAPCTNCGTHTSGIGASSDGLIWFDDSLQCIVGHFSLSTKAWKLYNTPTSGSHSHDGLAVDSSNRIWFDEEFANKLGEVV